MKLVYMILIVLTIGLVFTGLTLNPEKSTIIEYSDTYFVVSYRSFFLVLAQLFFLVFCVIVCFKEFRKRFFK